MPNARRFAIRGIASFFVSLFLLPAAMAGTIGGRVLDSNHSPLPGVTVELTASTQAPRVAVTGSDGTYAFANVGPGSFQVAFRLMNFAAVKRNVVVEGAGKVTVDATMLLSSSAEIVVTGKRTFHNLADLDQPVNDMIGIADAATVGVITAQQIESRPAQRSGDVLEAVPGVIISQHSGEGKANQYYLRGFNLDHGTDLAITIAGVPVNLPTHAHGQGYSDTNFLIPELISGVQYRKGPYYADEGDFSAAGAVNINYTSSLDAPIAFADGGGFGYGRALFADSPQIGGGKVLYAIEASRNNGPWVHPDDFRKLNGLLRYSRGNEQSGFTLTAMAYGGRWSSTDQVPDRAVEEGLISRFGSLDPTDGGRTHRYSTAAEWQTTRDDSMTKAQAYLFGYGLNLFSNFTYFLDDPVRGDQFEQEDRRMTGGAHLTHQWLSTFGRVAAESLAGMEVREDHIGAVGLYHTYHRQRLETIRRDRVTQTSVTLFYQSSLQWNDKLRTVAGLRGDDYHFDVRSNLAANSGRTGSALASPKLSVIAGPWNNSEVYANFGYGFHSNDARGSTLTVDPKSGEPADRVTPLVRARGGEIGFRTTAIPHVQTTVALWGLDVASELVFAGDAGTTEATRPSRRRGIEWTSYLKLSPLLTLDADAVWSRARFTDSDPAGRRIPGAPEAIASAGLTFNPAEDWTASLRYRYFGPRPLIEDNSVRSRASHTATARLTYALAGAYHLDLDVFNILNAKVSDIDYYYVSRLPGEPASGVAGIHAHPVEPRSVRFGISRKFGN